MSLASGPPQVFFGLEFVDYKFYPPDIRPISKGPNKGKYKLWEEWAYCWFENGRWHKIQIPKGVIHDGASIPRLLYTLTDLTPDGLIRSGALVHDHLYAWVGSLPKGWYQVSNSIGDWIDSPRVFTRHESDNLFLQINTESNMSWRRNVAYVGVVAGGWIPWWRYKFEEYMAKE